MKRQSPLLRRLLSVGVLAAPLLIAPPAVGGGLTLITHGLNGDVNGWVTGMAGQITNRVPGLGLTCYKLHFIPGSPGYTLSWMRLWGETPDASSSGEIVALLDWGPLAGGFTSNTFEVASAVVPRLLDADFIPELQGHALAEWPMHLIGHSRGGSLVCQISQLLGINGVWVDHLTTLDPHPLNNDGFSELFYSIVDAPCRTYENVLFHDNYYQLLDFFAYGEPVSGAYVRKLTSLNGGYGGLGGSHSDVHLWYHGSIDLRVPASDTEASITGSERQSWWTTYEGSGRTSGFHYSRIDGGDRLDTNRPAGSGTAAIRDGQNQRWSLGAGVLNNRTFLPSNEGAWPSLIQCRIAGTNVLVAGQNTLIHIDYQWAKPASSEATLQVWLDDDYAPWNGNEQLVQQFAAPGTTAGQVGGLDLNVVVDAATATPGVYSVLVRIGAGLNQRFLYAPDSLTVFSSFTPPGLSADLVDPTQLLLVVHGLPGQRVVIESSANLTSWLPIATNWLNANSWMLDEGVESGGQRFYRALLK